MAESGRRYAQPARGQLMLHGVLMAVVLAAGAGCREDSVGEPSRLDLAGNPVTLTYICGNTFRVRHTGDTERAVRWEVYGTAESGVLTLPPKPASAPYSESYFTTQATGTVRLFEGSTLLQTKANGNKPPCATPSDTARPPIPPYGYPADTTRLTVAPDDTSFVYLRTLLGVGFDDSTSGVGVQRALASVGGRIVGGLPGFDMYVIEMPDPGASMDSLTARRLTLRSQAGVRSVILMYHQDGPQLRDSRRPSDGVGMDSTAWAAGTSATWALRAIRAPLAWGCENGMYPGGAESRVGIVEWAFDETHPELATSVRATRPYRGTDGPQPAEIAAANVFHGTLVAGIIAAAADNHAGGAGLLWRGDLYLYSMGSRLRETRVSAEYMANVVLPAVVADGIRTLSISIEIARDLRSPELTLEFSAAMTRTLRSSRDLLIVKSSGNEPGSFSLDRMRSEGPLIISALSDAKVNGLDDQVLIVSGSAPGNVLNAAQTFIPFGTDIVAPSKDVAVLGLRSTVLPTANVPQMRGELVRESGTSVAAPMVAGVAAMLVRMDPSLTAREVKEMILQGARQEREDSVSGALPAAAPVAGVTTGGPIFQLDAYGALQHLSRERQQVPLCGLEVEGRRTGDGGYLLTANRRQPEPLVTLPPSAGGYSFSVAQGGRQLAVDGFDGNARRYVAFPFLLEGGRWRGLAPAWDVHRIVYLERDTAYFSFTDNPDDPRFDLFVSIGSEVPSRRVARRNLTADLFGGAAAWNANVNYISPTGDHVLIDWQGPATDVCAAPFGLFAIGVRGTPSRTTLLAGCHDAGRNWTTTAWRGDGTELYTGQFISGTNTSAAIRWRVGSWTVAEARPVATAGFVFDATWSPEGWRITRIEGNQIDTCFLRTLAATSLTEAPGGTAAVPPSYCADPVPQVLPALRDGMATSRDGARRPTSLRDWRTGPPAPTVHRLRSN